MEGLPRKPEALGHLHAVGNVEGDVAAHAGGGAVVDFNIGTSPYDVATTISYPGIGYFAFISCVGGTGDPDGSATVPLR